MHKPPYPYIQNRIHWCWAVACKMAGEQYKKNNPTFNFTICDSHIGQLGDVSMYEYEHGVISNTETGIREEVVKTGHGYYLIDAWQKAIVINAVDMQYNEIVDGDFAGDDESKVRGLRYVVTGNPDSNQVTAVSLGYFDSKESLIEKFGEKIYSVFQSNNFVIGNAVLYPDRVCHSFVLLGVQEKKICLYDPWDGTITYHTENEVFETGFSSALGIGSIKWVQFLM